jgi:hypothetical protein
MTEQEWLESDDLWGMIDFLQLGGKVSERKFRLFNAACCRLFFRYVQDERFREAVEAAERYADGLTSKAALRRSRQAVRAARQGLGANRAGTGAGWVAYWLAEVGAAPEAYTWLGKEIDRLAPAIQGWMDDLSTRNALLRDVVGTLPFRTPPAIASGVLAWNGGTVTTMANAIYANRDLPSGHLDTARLAVLADALEEAGCDQADLLAHLRGPGPHVRGCWVVDLLLGKE